MDKTNDDGDKTLEPGTAAEPPIEIITLDLWMRALRSLRKHPHEKRFRALLGLFRECVGKSHLSLPVPEVEIGMKEFCRHQSLASMIGLLNLKLRGCGIGLGIHADEIVRSANNNAGPPLHRTYTLQTKGLAWSKSSDYKKEQLALQRKNRAARRVS